MNLFGQYMSGFGLITLILVVISVVHAVRHGNIFPWIFLILFLPLIGSLIYFVVAILPDLRSSRRARTMQRGVAKMADPNRDFRAAKRDVELVGSADAKKRLAEEYMARGSHADAVDLYRSALTGAHSDDPALLYGLARAQLAKGDGAGTEASLDMLRQVSPKAFTADAHLAYARALEMQGKDTEALAEYAKLVRYFPGEEARGRYALLLQKTGQQEQAREMFLEILKLTDGASKRYRAAQREWSDVARRNTAAP
jgi:hypothetical protein